MIQNKLSQVLYWIYSRVYHYQIGKYYWWNWIAVIYGYVDAKVIYWLYSFLRPDHWANERTIEEMAGEATTLFIMGSGASVNNITDEEWTNMKQVGDVLSFNYFFRGEFVPIDYHIVREFERPPAPWNMSMLTSRGKVNEYCEGLLSNPEYDDCAFFVLRQPPTWSDRASAFGIWTTYFSKYFAGHDLCFYQNGSKRVPGEDIDDVSHVGATLTDAINIGYLMGYDTIVLVGVDLYNREYFWSEEGEVRELDEERGVDSSEEHRTAPTITAVMADWKEYLGDRGTSLYVENSRSLVHTKSDVPAYDLKNPSQATT